MAVRQHFGGHKAVVRPDPIPNSAVKRSLADGSGCLASARVGCRQFLLKAEMPEGVSAFLRTQEAMVYFSRREWVSLFLDLWELFLPGEAQVVFALEVKPELRIDAEIEAQTRGGVGPNAALSAYDHLSVGCEMPESLAIR